MRLRCAVGVAFLALGLSLSVGRCAPPKAAPMAPTTAGVPAAGGAGEVVDVVLAATEEPTRGAPVLDLVLGRVVRVGAMSRDGAMVAFPGPDGEIGVRDAATGRLTHALRSHPGRIVEMDFGPDGTLLASLDATGEIRLWGLPTGECRLRLRLGEDGPLPLTHSRFLESHSIPLAVSGDGERRFFERSPSAQPNLLRFSQDGRFLLTGGPELAVWNAVTGEKRVLQRAEREPEGRATGPLTNAWPLGLACAAIFDAAFIEGTDRVAALSTVAPNPYSGIMLAYPAMLDLHGIDGPAEDLARLSEPLVPTPLALSPDGRLFVGAEMGPKKDSRLAPLQYGVYSVADRSRVAFLEPPPAPDEPSHGRPAWRPCGWAWAMDSSAVAANDDMGGCAVWDSSTGELRFAPKPQCHELLGFTETGALLGWRGDHGLIHIVSAETGDGLRTLRTGLTDARRAPAGSTSCEGAVLHTGLSQDAWSLDTGELHLGARSEDGSWKRVLAIAESGRKVLWQSGPGGRVDGALNVVEPDGRVSSVLDLPPDAEVAFQGPPCLGFSHTGERVVAGLPNGQLAVWDCEPARGWSDAALLGDLAPSLHRLVLSEDGFVAWTAGGYALLRWDIADLQAVAATKVDLGSQGGLASALAPLSAGSVAIAGCGPKLLFASPDPAAPVESVAVASAAVIAVGANRDRSLLATLDQDGAVRLLDVRTRQPQWEVTLPRALDGEGYIEFAPDGRRLLVTRTLRGTDVLRLSDGALLVTLRALECKTSGGPEWLAFTPDGWWTGSPGVANLLRWETSEGVVGEPATSRMHSPEKVREALVGAE